MSSLFQRSYRRQLVGNTLIVTLAIATVVQLLFSLFCPYSEGFNQEERSLSTHGIFLLLIVFLWYLSRRGHQRLTILERTRELRETQLLRNMELERFAEFGRLSASLLHEVTNPLTAASLHLEQFDTGEHRLVDRARASLQQLERYIVAARKQLKHEGELSVFSVAEELGSLVLITKPLANRDGIKLSVFQNQDYTIYGDPIKFNQMLANLVTNAIDAYHDFDPKNHERSIHIWVKANAKQLKIIVSDHGKGITKQAIPHIFESFYSTKTNSTRGTGIGLSMVKRIVEHDFQGTIQVSNSRGDGTQFRVRIPLA